MERPTRRDVLKTAAGAGALITSGAVSTAQAAESRVEDVDGRPIGGARVDALLLFAAAQDQDVDAVIDSYGRYHVASTTTATQSDSAPTGSFSLDLSTFPPRQFRASVDPGPYLVLIARYEETVEVARERGDGGIDTRTDRWFGSEVYEAEAFADAGPYVIELNNRSVHDSSHGFAKVNTWHRIQTDGDRTDHYVISDITGDLEPGSGPFADDLSEPGDGWSPLGKGGAAETDPSIADIKAGMFSLQVPDDIEVDYDNDDTNTLTPWWTGPRYDTPAYHPSQLTVAQDQHLDWSIPAYDAFGPLQSVPNYDLYDEAAARSGPSNALFGYTVLNKGITAIGGILAGAGLLGAGIATLPVAIGVSVLLTGLGFAVSEASEGEKAKIEPNNIPNWVRKRESTGTGSLPVDNDRHDVIITGWRYETYGAAQRVPVEFPDDEPRQFCIRGLAKVRPKTSDDDFAVQLEDAFVIDPQRRSPLDPAGRQPSDPIDTDGQEDEQKPPVADISAGRLTPEVDQTVTLDASDTDVAGVKDVADYQWTVSAPGGTSASLPDGERTVELTPERTGAYIVRLTVTDTGGLTDTAQETVVATEKTYGEVPPVAADVSDEECEYPPTGESYPATGRGATSHFGYGCGDWKVYEVVPFESYRVASTVDGCMDCLLYDGAYVIEEPIEGGPEPEGESGEDPAAAGPWREVKRIEDAKGKSFAGQINEVEFKPQSEFVRIRNIDGNSGKGFYAELFGPNPVEGEP